MGFLDSIWVSRKSVPNSLKKEIENGFKDSNTYISPTEGPSSNDTEMTWYQFERLVEEKVKSALDSSLWRIRYHHRPRGPETLIMDIHVAERKQGGIGVVIDAKHYRKKSLPKNEIVTTENYRIRSNASYAMIIGSPGTTISPTADNLARNLGIPIFIADSNLETKVRQFFSEIKPRSEQKTKHCSDLSLQENRITLMKRVIDKLKFL